MLQIKEYCKVQSLEEAYELNKKKANRIIAGGVWMKMGDRKIATAIDLSGLGLNTITEDDTKFVIGCMTSLRDLEQHKGLEAYTNGALKESLRHIVGVQFRNCATVGGSIFGRFGFSDVLTLLLALETEVELFHAGRIPLSEFVDMPYDNDILVSIHIKKRPVNVCYQSKRNTATDFPTTACAVAKYGELIRISVGARPGRAKMIEIEANQVPKEVEAIKAFGKETAAGFSFGSNRRAGAEYRAHVTGVLISRAILKLSE